MLGVDGKKQLLNIARKSIEHFLSAGEKFEVHTTDPDLMRPAGVFVTIKRRGNLRGCIGTLVSEEPLCLMVRDMAVSAALQDPRFPPVKLSELSDIRIEISVLSDLERMNDPENIKMGEHGVMVKKGNRCGVFLPQVQAETGWEMSEFMERLCVDKAGLAPDAWRTQEAEIFIFTADVFTEKDRAGI